jgi:peroxiredoxin
MALSINADAPNFTAQTTEGTINFHEWIDGAWAVLFSHPKDFTPVCTTELGYMARIKPEFDRRGVKIIGLSVDPLDRHEEWAKDIEETQGTAPNYPLISDADFAISKSGIGIVVVDDDRAVEDFFSRISDAEDSLDLGAEGLIAHGAVSVRGKDANPRQVGEGILRRRCKCHGFDGLDNNWRQVSQNRRRACGFIPKKPVCTGRVCVFRKNSQRFIGIVALDGEGEIGDGRAIGKPAGFCEVDAGALQCGRIGDSGKDIPPTYAFELVRVAEENETGIVGKCLQKGFPKQRIDHGALVNDEKFARQTMPGMVSAAVFSRVMTEQGVDRSARGSNIAKFFLKVGSEVFASLLHRLLHPVGSLARGGCELNRFRINASLDEEGKDAGEGVGFSRAWTARNNGDPLRECQSGGIALAACRRKIYS